MEGVENAFAHGKRIAVEGCLTSCGARLIANSRGSLATTAGTDWRNGPGYPRFEPLPPAPPPLADFEMKDFHKQAEKQGLGDRKTLAQYHLVASGISSAASNGWETYIPHINDEILVYVKNINLGPAGIATPVTARAGISHKNIQEYQLIIASNKEYIFTFKNRVFEKWYISVDANTDVYLLNVEVWARLTYAK